MASEITGQRIRICKPCKLSDIIVMTRLESGLVICGCGRTPRADTHPTMTRQAQVHHILGDAVGLWEYLSPAGLPGQQQATKSHREASKYARCLDRKSYVRFMTQDLPHLTGPDKVPKSKPRLALTSKATLNSPPTSVPILLSILLCHLTLGGPTESPTPKGPTDLNSMVQCTLQLGCHPPCSPPTSRGSHAQKGRG